MLTKVERSVYIKAPPALVFRILAAYETYRLWAPDVTESRVLAAEGQVSVAELQSPPLAAGKLMLEFVEFPSSQLIFHQVDRFDEGGLSGRFELEGADDGDGVVVRAVLSKTRRLFGFGGRRRMRDVLERTLSALRRRALRMVAVGSTGEYSQRTKIVELRRTGDVVEVDLHGDLFTLSRSSGEHAR